ncbi:PHP domain-containing protein [Lachnoclostridium sp. Marseille-P6806]|uniref:PHP domain-containing protein n=1 Tax=Lachnoclostridium sp. Marseille-P6806 TaxID=2364793 RepID=UPI0013EF173A|nr:hypothetical protein [Lachnoclostridium sp. Marseille-P6806]
MSFHSIFRTDGSWYKGNLHMHSTRSDGKLPPQEALDIYHRAGYDFAALTDHRRPGITLEPGRSGVLSGENSTKENGTKENSTGENGFGERLSVPENMLLLSGVEWDTGGANTRMPGDVATWHILGIGMTEDTGDEAFLRCPHPAPQEIVDHIRGNGGIAVLCHPAWSVMDPAGLREVEGFAAAEIYNAVSDIPWNGERADASAWFDIWATHHGILMPAVAGDDAHSYNGDQCRSFTMVKAAELTSGSILAGLRDGQFYASRGPLIYDVQLDEERGDLHIDCSADVMTAVFYSNAIWVPQRVRGVRGGSVDYHAEPGEFYLRAELLTREGRRAYTSPIPLRSGRTD